MKNMIQIDIVNNIRQSSAADCGTDWFRPVVIAQARDSLEKIIGKKICLTYTDISTDEKMRAKFRDEKLFPLLVVDGQICLAGQFDLRQITDVIQAHLEIRVGR